MGLKCDACLREFDEKNPVRHGEMKEGAVVSDEKYGEIDGILSRVHKDLEFRSRVGLAYNLKRVHHWFRFHGPFFPEIPERAKAPAPIQTQDNYKWVSDFCE